MKQSLTLTIAEGETVELDSTVKHLSEQDKITVVSVEQHSQAGDRPVVRVNLCIERYGEE